MLRRMNKFFSILLVIAMILSMIPAPGHDGHDHGHVHAAASSTLFLKPNSEWLVDGARFAAYFFGNGEKWVSMTGPDSNGYYKVSVPSGYPSVIFCRMNGGTTDNTWDNKWNQTADLTIPTSGECCWTLNSGDWGGGGAWSHKWNSGSVTKAATCTATGTKTYTCSLCSGTKTESIAATGHSYTSKVTAATCTAQGYTTWTCSKCSNSYKDTYTSALGHSYTSSVTKAATCTATGTRKYTCSRCSTSYTETIAKLGHNYTSKVTAPTCTAQGYTTWTCSRCSNSYKDTYTNATGHSYSSSTGACTKCGAGCSHSYSSSVTKAATCTATGTRKYTCSTCSYSYTETIAKLGHNYTSKVTAPTCTAQGYTTYTCSRCSDSYTGNTTAATGHSYTSKVTKAATCTAAGTRTYTCSKCSGTYTESIAATGHSYTSKVTAPTCTAAGYTTHTCSSCGNSYTDSQTAATGHSYSGATCSSCGATRSYYLFGYINGANYACEEDSSNIGTYKFVNNTLTVTFTSNSYVAVKTGDNLSWYMTDGYPGDGVTSATLYNTNKGISADKLYVPGGTEVKFTLTVNTDETLKLSYTILSCEHTYDSGTVTKAATCTADGTKTYTCTKCANTKTETIAATGHSYSGATCSTCGNTRTYYLFGFINGANYACEEDAANIGTYKFSNNTLSVTFTSDSWVAVKTGDNLSWYMTDGYPGDMVSSATLYNTDKGIDANKLHVPGGTTVKFTLTVNTDETLKLSYTITSCSHNYSSEVTKAATCTTAGTKTYTCSICGNSYTESIAALGHSYDSGTVTTAATCTADGVKTYTCATCKGTKTEAITKLGHSYSTKVTAATCTAQGYTTHTCSRCSDSYKDTYTAATGHSYGTNGVCSKCGTGCSHSYDSGKVTTAATCTTDGVKTYTCSVCGGTKTEAITKLGHSYSSKVTAPTCTAAGYTTYTCSTCGDSYTANNTAATGHSYSSKVTTAATCTSDGVKTYTCSVCSASYTEKIAALGHSYKSVVTAPTCTAGGYTTYTCSTCGGSYTDSQTAATGHSYVGDTCSSCGDVRSYYLFGFINGANYGCEEDASTIGQYKFEGGKLTVTFDSDSYVAVKTGDNLSWYMTEGYDDSLTSVKLYNTSLGLASPDKMFVPGGAEVTFSLTVNTDETLQLSYVISSCSHNYTESITKAATCTAAGEKTFTCSICANTYTEAIAATGHSYVGDTCSSCGDVRSYYLFGFINGANYACEEDYANIGTYKFVDGKLTVTFESDSYVAVKTGDNQSWYMTNGYPGDEATSATLYNTATEGIEVNKLRIPGRTTVELTLVVNTDETLQLSYEILECSHDYTSEVTAEPTCTATGTKVYTCGICGDSYTESIAAKGHSYASVVTAPTCTAQGYTTHTCSVCGDSYKDTYVAATGHSYGSNGVCGNCGEGCDHSYDSGKVTTAATCTAAGVKTYTCSLCGGTKTEEIAKLGHSYSSKVTAPTCTAEGYTTYTCGTCGDNYTGDQTVATGHSYVGDTCSGCGDVREYYLFGYINGANYACEEDSENIGTYKFVGGKLTVTFTSDSYVAVKTGDNQSWYMTNGYPGDDATSATLYNTTTSGIEVNKLRIPGGAEVVLTLTVNTDETLVLSYEISSCSHSYSSEVTKAATCTEDGTITYTCSICGNSYTETVAAKGHSYVGQSCTSCGTKRSYYLFGYINGANYACEEDSENIGTYKFEGGKLTVTFECDSYVGVKTGDNQAWYMANGYPGDDATSATLYNTTTPDIVVDKMRIPGGAEVVLTLTVNDDETMVLSYEITSCSHSYSSEVTKEATCTTDGSVTYTCSICGSSYTETIPATGHSYVGDTCTACGTKREYYLFGFINGANYGCEEDDQTIGIYKFESGKLTVSFTSDSYVAVKTGDNQSWYMTNGYPGDGVTSAKLYNTNTEGIEVNKLMVPGGTEVVFTLVVNTDETLDLSYEISSCSHDYSSEVTKAATCTESGTLTYTCSICGSSYTESIPATDHSYDEGKVTSAATCTEAGVKTFTCGTCGKTYTEAIAAPGHSYDDGVVTAPTCTAAGYTTYTCTVCGNSYTGNETAATGHSYSDGVCTGCGEAEPTVEYYLFGYINGANYACEEDSANVGEYRFVDGQLVVTFDSDSYVAVKTGDNAKWYMTNGYPGDDATSATLYDTSVGIEADKLRIPGGVQVTMTLTVNEDGTLTLSYVTAGCQHSYTGSVTTAATCTEAGEMTYTCDNCGDSYTESIAATGHSYVGGKCTVCGEAEPTVDYYLFGFINGANYACEEDTANIGIYKFVDGKLTVTFTSDSYVAVKTGDNAKWYMCEGYDASATTVTLYNTAAGIAVPEKMFVPGNVEVTFTLVVNGDDTLTLSYTTNSTSCDHPSHGTDGICPDCGTKVDHTYEGDTCTVCGTVRSYYLFGFINGANYACEEDEANIGTYKFEDGKLVATFESDSYVAVKTGDNLSWYMTDGYDDTLTSVKLYNTASGIADPNKLFVPGGVEVTFSLTVNATDDTLTLSYLVDGASCTHANHDTEGNCTLCGTAVEHTFQNGACTVCGKACEHSWTDGKCTVCGLVCAHGWTDGTCGDCGTVCEHPDHNAEGICDTCGGTAEHTYVDGVCSVCGDGCAHDWVSGVCSKCGNSCDHSWSGGTCSNCGMVSNGITVHFVNTLGWNGVVAYAWEASTDTALSGYSWPGAIINRDADGYYTVTLDYTPASGKSLGLIFHNWNGGQTADVTISYATLNETREVWVKPSSTANSDGKYDCTVATAKTGLVLSPEVNGTSVTFRYQGSASSVYLAGSMNSWSSSATKLTQGSDGIWSVTLTLDPGVHEYKFVVDGEWVTDPSNTGLGGYDGNCTVVVPTDDTVTDTGKINVVLHFYRSSGDYSGWDVWFWCNESSGSAAFSADPNNKGMIATYTVDGATNANIGYTVRKTDWSDKEFYDRFIDLTDVRSGTVHYFLNSGSASGLRVLGEDVISAAKLSYANYNYDADTVWVKTTLPLSSVSASNFSIVDGNGNATGVSVTGVSIDGNGYSLTLSRALSLTEACSYQVKYGSFYCYISYNAHNIFYTDKFASEYTYHGDDLGATWSKSSTTFKVWAPTAKQVYVKIFDSGNYGSGNQVQYVEMKQGGQGTWYVTVSGNLSGYYYNYDVVFPSYTVEATDPYAKGVGANGDRGMIVDLDSTDPSGWSNDISPNKYMSYTDAIIYEMHIREMTIDSSSGVKDAWKGKYLGLTQSGTSYNGYSTGLQHLKELGVTHVQLMPAYDFSSVDEYHLTDWAQYAWGYDPKNFNVPEGGYATDPFDGATRITEFKQMVQTFHANGINVVMDVVYNHTFDGGNYCGNKIVPNYYSRFYGEGNWSNGSGVGNDFATERAMARNLIVDSILHWVEEYHIDGFRFDLAGLIDTVTINDIVNAVHAKYPYVMFYGEGWAPGGTAVQYGYNLATKGNAWEVGGFGFFNDDFRNAIAGDNGNSWGFATGAGDKYDTIASAFRASNGWSSSPTQTINYVSCHDNYCLTDKIIISRNGAYWDQMARMNGLSTAMVMLSQGVPFIYSGDEMLREKKDASGNRYDNAYGTDDYINKIRWSDLQDKEYAQRTDDYYAGLIAFRKNHAALRCASGSDAWNATSVYSINSNTMLVYVDGYYNYECSDGICMIFNGSDTTQWVSVQNYIPDGYYQATIHGTQAGNSPLWGKDVNDSSDAVGVEPFSVTVLVKGDLVHEESVYNQNMSLVNCAHSSHTTSGLCTSCGATVDHSFSGGSCSVCGLSASAPSTITVYYDNSTTSWSNVYAYAWAEAGGRTTEYTASWPGTAMTDMGSGIFAIELPIEATNLIFNDGSGNQSSNLTAPAYTSDATMYDPSTASWVTYEASCKHTSHTTEGICSDCGLAVSHSYAEGVCTVCGGTCEHTWASGTCYTCQMVCQHVSHNTSGDCVVCGVAQEHTYTTDGTCSGCGLECWHSWNGDTCNTCGYVCAHAEHTTSGLCTKCGSDAEHSYTDGVCTVCGLSEDAPETITIYYDNSGSQWETVYAYAWAEAAGRTVMYTDGWPGTAMTLVEGDIWSITLDRNASTVIFNDGSGSQTGNMSVPAYDSGVDMYRSATGLWATYGVACEHTYVDTVTEPTCTEAGYTTHRCSLCGESYTDTETEALGHSYVDDVCSVCGEADPNACQHEYESVVTDPTCTEAGYTTHTCTLCGKTYTDTETAALDHSYVDGACERCGAVDPATCEHTYESVVTDATCTEDGSTVYTCSVCGDSYTETIAALGHSYESGVCTVCGEAEPADETITVYYDNTSTAWSTVRVTAETESGETITDVEMTEVSEGVYAYDLPADTTSVTFSDGGENKSDKKTMPERGSGKNMYDASTGEWTTYAATSCEHTYESVVTEPTCTEAGYTTHTCTLCGDSYTDTEVEAPGHTYVDGTCSVCGEADYDSCEHTFETSTVSPTCDTEGYTANTCTICGYVEKSDIVEAKGHSYSNGMCTVCGKPKPLSTTYYLIGYINGANYGCEEDGENMGVYKFENNMLKATFESTSYVFVKTEGNAKWYMCDGYPGDGVNSANLYDTTTDIQHDKVNVPGAVEITFTLIERDDGSLTLTYVKAGECSHTYYSYTSQEPGCTTTGVKTYRCSLCADTYTTTIAATGHNYSGAYCTNCGAESPYYSATYYLFGYINGANYACEEDGANIGIYKFSYGKLVATFDQPSYVAVKTSDNAKWYMTNGYPGDDATSVRLYDTSTGIDANKMRVPGGVQITFTLTENSDGSLTLSYVAAACSHTYDDGWVSTPAGCTTSGVRTRTCTKCGATKDETIAATGHNYVDGACAGCGDVTSDYVEEFYLFGWINGGNYACEEDYANMGEFKFVDGLLTATFQENSYIGIKTSGNLKWYMTQAYVAEGTTSGTFYDTATGAGEKMFVPGGVELSFVLTKNADGSLTLNYTTDGSCAHSFGEGEVYTAATCTAEGSMRYTCSLCGHVKSEVIPATGHSFTGDTCVTCGYVCTHEFEMVTHEANCSAYADYEFICGVCGTSEILHAEDMADWMETIPERMPAEMFESKTEYRYRDHETLVSMEPTMDGYTLVSSQWINANTNTIYYVQSWPTGFDTTNELYAQYNNIDSKVTASETETDRLVIDSDEIVGYLYYHWCYDGYPYTVATKQGSYNRFHAYYSTKAPSEADKNDPSDDSYRFDDSTACDDSVWYFYVPVYGQVYTTSQQEFTYERWTEWSDWSEEVATASDTREVQSRTLYRLPDVALGDHVYESVVTEPTCTEPGYTTHTCTACGDSYTDTETAATGHSYVDGTCEHCGEQEQITVTDPGLTLSYPSLSFEDEIFYNVYFTVADMSSVQELGLMLLSSRNDAATIDDAIGLVPGHVTNGTLYMVRSEGIAAAYMGDTVYFKIYAKLSDGTYAYSTAGGYNAKAYANTVLNGSYTDEMKALVVAMVNYGAEAQTFFGHNTDKLVNSALTDEQKALVAAYDSTMMDAVVPADSTKTTDFVRVSSNFKQLYPSVSFDSAFAINFYCTPAITVDSGMTLYYWDMETMEAVEKLSLDNATGSMEMTDTNGMYWGQVSGIAAKEMDKTYYVTCVFESEGETITTGIIAYSLGKYCQSKAATDGDAQQTFAQATAVYGYYAKQYFASIA